MTGPARRALRRPVRLRGRALFGGGPAAVTIATGAVTIAPGATTGWRWAVGGEAMRPLAPADLAPLPHRSTLLGRAVLPEHLLAALVMLDIDDCDVRFEAGEAPILDGSARPFVQALRSAGIVGPPPRHDLRVEVSVRGVTVTWRGATGPAAARTFTELADVRRSASLFPGARPGCALVLAGSSSRYGGRPRLPHEPAWHKLLDVLGDLGPWRARGRLSGRLALRDPSHVGNPAAIERALRDGDLVWSP